MPLPTLYYDQWRKLTTFNSLFEMLKTLSDAGISETPRVLSSFNSLFEMLEEREEADPVLNVVRLSILYLRCRSGTPSADKRYCIMHFQFSI